MIELKHLHKYYNRNKQNEIHVINDVTLELPDSGMCAIFGPSGCGKTTLLNVIGGLDSVANGFVEINGGQMTVKDGENAVVRNRDIGFIFQNYNLNKRESVYENVAASLRLCGMKDESVIEERVKAALANVGMENYAKRLPDTLSGGQQQRVAIARAIVKNPPVILADEPTGNLDEANTILVMDILKEMSKDHLVLIVTHEANLVDYYCDMVIELKDGQVVEVRKNDSANGYVARNKNDIFLGELDQHVQNDGNTEVTYYGDAPETPIRITVINQNGRFFLQLNTPKVSVIDESSEVHIREGKFQENEEQSRKEASVDMSKLPPFEGSNYGKRFSLKSSVISGYRDNFKMMMQSKGKKRLRVCLALFGAAIVFFFALFGTGIGNLLKAKKTYNNETFLVSALTEDIRDQLIELMNDPANGIDDIGIGNILRGSCSDLSLRFGLARFESTGYYDEGLEPNNFISENVTLLPEKLAKGLEVIAGTGELADGDVLISKAVVKLILKDPPFNYFDDYSDFIGLQVNIGSTKQKLKVVGIVDTKEISAYVNDYTRAVLQVEMRDILPNVSDDLDGYFDVGPGECVLLRKYFVEMDYPEGYKPYDNYAESYEDYLNSQQGDDPEDQSDPENRDNPESQENPDGQDNPENGDNPDDPVPVLTDTPEYPIDDSNNDPLDDYYRSLQQEQLEMERKDREGVKEGDYIYYNGMKLLVKKIIDFELPLGMAFDETIINETYSKIFECNEHLRAEHIEIHYGGYYDEWGTFYEDEYGNIDKDKKDDVEIYPIGMLDKYNKVVVMSREDFITGANWMGKTSLCLSADESVHYGRTGRYEPFESTEMVTYPGDTINGAKQGTLFNMYNTAEKLYYTVHSNNIEATENALKRVLVGLEAPGKERGTYGNDGYVYSAIYTPDDRYREATEGIWKTAVRMLAVGGIMLGLMCICMYFIMRSTFLNRTKEIGIYRAIGVTKKNVLFRFVVETGVIATLSVIIGYICGSLVIWYLSTKGSMVGEYLYYPAWMAVIVLVFLYTVSIVCGMIPVFLLLRKTPSQILAKYDI